MNWDVKFIFFVFHAFRESSLESFDFDHFLPLLLCPSFSHLSLYILSGNIEDALNDHASRWFLLLLILISYILDISPIPNLHQLLSPQIERYQGICFIDLLSFQLITECLYGNCSHVLFLSCVQILGKNVQRHEWHAFNEHIRTLRCKLPILTIGFSLYALDLKQNSTLYCRKSKLCDIYMEFSSGN